MLSALGEIIESLQQRLRQWGQRPDAERLSSGSGALDSLLPAGGFQRGTLVEWLGDAGSGATTLALLTAREACRQGGALVVMDPQRRFYPPAAAGLGMDLNNLVIVCPQDAKDASWAMHQALSCPAVAAVLCWPEKLDSRTFRRWQLAAETGGSLGLLVQPSSAAGRPAWSDVQLRMQALPGDDEGRNGRRRWRVELLRCRGGAGGRSIDVELDDETNTLHLASQLAPATSARSARGA